LSENGRDNGFDGALEDGGYVVIETEYCVEEETGCPEDYRKEV
jgi:hypothetical protein